jgi:hypothetical protein
MTGERLSNQIPEDLVRDPKVPEPTKAACGALMMTAGGSLLEEGGLAKPAIGAGLVLGGLLATMPEAIKGEGRRRMLENIRQALRQEGK